MNPTRPRAPLPDTLWPRLAQLRHRVMDAMQESLASIAGLELSLPQATALFQIGEREPLSVAQLQGLLRRSQGATSHLVTQLEKRGLVVRKADPADGRRSALHLTRKGRQLVGQVEAAREEGVARLLGQVPPGVVQQLDEALGAVLDALATRENEKEEEP